jgi:PIN domain nuclease of toxin-antitoxin system
MIDDSKLPAHCAAWIEDRANEVAVSPLSAYEIRFKAAKGLFPGGEALAADIGPMSNRAGFVMVPLEHTLAAGALALPHRDPFDRMLAAQAIVNGYAILSADAAFDRLGASRVW